MSSDTTASMPVPETGSGGAKKTSCPLHGCKRMYSDTAALESHVKDHEISAESLPGKVLLCSTVGCSGSFPDMQKLMEHMRHHHKPNIFFLCESCRTKLRSYRGLLTHLHTCSKVSRGKPKPSEPAALAVPAPSAVIDVDPNPDQNPPLLDPVSTPQPPPSVIPKTDDSLLSAVLDTDPTPPVLGPPFLSNPETCPPHFTLPDLTDTASQTQIKNEPFDLPLALNPGGPTAAPAPPDAEGQHPSRAMSPEPVFPAHGPAPHSPPMSAAIWKKGQGACSRRILWEHTKGRYTCVQCGHAVSNRKEMTHHISTKHSKPTDDAGGSAASS